MTTSPPSSDDYLLPILQRAIPTATSYRHADGIISQANAEGARILARYPSTVSEKLQDDDDDGDGDGDGDGEMAASDTANRRSHEHDSRLVVSASQPHRRDVGEDDYEETELFLKRVRASTYAHKSWTDMRRTLVYLRTEVRFYNEFVPLLLSSSSSSSSSNSKEESRTGLRDTIPKCYHAAYDLEGLVRESSPATDVRAPSPFPATATAPPPSLQRKGGHILLQSLSTPSRFQSSPLTPRQSLSCLRSLAEFHAASLGNAPLLTLASRRLSPAGGSYHLRFRNPEEVRRIEESWEGFRRRFWEGMDDIVKQGRGRDWKRLLEKEGVANLGRRMRDMAEWVSDRLTPGAEEEGAVLVHGDFKAMNVFLPSELQTHSPDVTTTIIEPHDIHAIPPAILIDFSCVGIGHPLSDVAMHIAHALPPHHLQNGGEDRLVEAYLLALERAVRGRRGEKKDSSWTFPREEARRQYRLACVDYARFIMGRFWRTASPETFENKRGSGNTTLINRDVDAAMAFVEKVDGYLEMFEKERERECGKE